MPWILLLSGVCFWRGELFWFPQHESATGLGDEFRPRPSTLCGTARAEPGISSTAGLQTAVHHPGDLFFCGVLFFPAGACGVVSEGHECAGFWAPKLGVCFRCFPVFHGLGDGLPLRPEGFRVGPAVRSSCGAFRCSRWFAGGKRCRGACGSLKSFEAPRGVRSAARFPARPQLR